MSDMHKRTPMTEFVHTVEIVPLTALRADMTRMGGFIIEGYRVRCTCGWNTTKMCGSGLPDARHEAQRASHCHIAKTPQEAAAFDTSAYDAFSTKTIWPTMLETQPPCPPNLHRDHLVQVSANMWHPTGPVFSAKCICGWKSEWPENFSSTRAFAEATVHGRLVDPTRCIVCEWPLSKDDTGCTSNSCSYRPGEHTVDYHSWRKRVDDLGAVGMLPKHIQSMWTPPGKIDEVTPKGDGQMREVELPDVPPQFSDEDHRLGVLLMDTTATKKVYVRLAWTIRQLREALTRVAQLEQFDGQSAEYWRLRAVHEGSQAENAIRQRDAFRDAIAEIAKNLRISNSIPPVDGEEMLGLINSTILYLVQAHDSLPNPSGVICTKGMTAIQIERHRQITKEGYTPAHDAAHTYGELGRAAGCYLEAAIRQITGYSRDYVVAAGERWPWKADNPASWKPAYTAARNLEKAGALLAAQLDLTLSIKPPFHVTTGT